MPVLADIFEEFLLEIHIHAMKEGESCTISFNCLTHMLTQVFILGNVLEESIRLLLRCKSRSGAARSQVCKFNLRRIFWNIHEVRRVTIVVYVPIINITIRRSQCRPYVSLFLAFIKERDG